MAVATRWGLEDTAPIVAPIAAVSSVPEPTPALSPEPTPAPPPDPPVVDEGVDVNQEFDDDMRQLMDDTIKAMEEADQQAALGVPTSRERDSHMYINIQTYI